MGSALGRGKKPHELAKGRDLSAEAHQRVWTSLFTRAEVVVPGAAATLYERVMDPAKWRPYEDTRPTLVALRERRVPTAVVSNVPRDLRPIFERHGLRELVDAFVLSYEHGAMKPAAALFRAACEAVGVAPEHVLMVGDDPITDGGAAAAGLQTHVLPAVLPGVDGVRGLAAVVRLVDRSRRHRVTKADDPRADRPRSLDDGPPTRPQSRCRPR